VRRRSALYWRAAARPRRWDGSNLGVGAVVGEGCHCPLDPVEQGADLGAVVGILVGQYRGTIRPVWAKLDDLVYNRRHEFYFKHFR
jgi:hypothetical protein